jgi:hypothetical protein
VPCFEGRVLEANKKERKKEKASSCKKRMPKSRPHRPKTAALPFGEAVYFLSVGQHLNHPVHFQAGA